MMVIEIVQQSTKFLAGYHDIRISFKDDSHYQVHAVDDYLGGWKLAEEAVQPSYSIEKFTIQSYTAHEGPV